VGTNAARSAEKDNEINENPMAERKGFPAKLPVTH
jgi:hypothetical protein